VSVAIGGRRRGNRDSDRGDGVREVAVVERSAGEALDAALAAFAGVIEDGGWVAGDGPWCGWVPVACCAPGPAPATPLEALPCLIHPIPIRPPPRG
jgi:hypothetical protein